MARILYGVAGEGFGHSSRSSLIGKQLIDAGHDVLFAASRKSLCYLSQYFPDRVREVYGLHFVFQQGKVRPVKTFWSNLTGYSKGIGINRRLFRDAVRPFAPDVVLSDFEPFSAWWAWRNRVPCISLDHEHMLTLCRLDPIPGHRMDQFLATLVTRGYHTGANAYMILNFFRSPLKNSSAVLSPPVVREQVRRMRPQRGEHITMYLTGTVPGVREQLCGILKQFPGQRFFVYGFDVDQEDGNLLFKKTSTEGFLEDLASCRGAAGTAGFSLISECLHFRKKMLLSPVRCQFEQIVNAHYVQKTGWGRSIRELNCDEMDRFLSEVDSKPDEADSTILWPDNGAFFRILEKTLTNIGLNISLENMSAAGPSNEKNIR